MTNYSATDSSNDSSDQSLADATEELVAGVLQPEKADFDDLTRRFPSVAGLLQNTSSLLPRGSKTNQPRTARDPNPLAVRNLETVPGSADEPGSTGILGRGEARDICVRFEDGLKRGLGPLIENEIRDVAEPQRSALLSMLLAAELRAQESAEPRPMLDDYRRRFPGHDALVEAVFRGAIGPARIGRFVVIRLLGKGAFGKVYLARDEQLDRLVAIKVPHARLTSDPAQVERILREAKLAARVEHPGIVSVYQVDRDGDAGCFLVFEYINGYPLAELLRTPTLSRERSAELVIWIAEALAHAHENRLVHRDLKPDNILLDLRGRPHIADFGLALHEDDRWPKRGEVAGSPNYMAPEQVRGESHRLDGRTDIWSLGVIFYRMLTGARPFQGTCTDEVFDEILNREPVPPRQRDRTIPKELERICLKCLAKRMTDRYASASDLADDLRFWLGSGGRDIGAEAPISPAGTRDGEPDLTRGNALVADSRFGTAVVVRPKGLRAFDVDDRDFFLSLLPGPRDREGLPESLRFWKVRIEPEQGHEPFTVGMLCGPSGSGKTSMVRAGLLCRLSPAVVPLYVEATPGTTETRLLDALHRVAGDQATGMSLVDTMAGLRGRVLLPAGQKVLIVLDQFEQWLHVDHDPQSGEAELITALRQCDGANVQCLILVRDDFAMAAARFMRALEVRLVESQNFATLDPFDQVHARKVLRAFGLAYDRFRDDEPGPHDRFLELAVEQLAEDGKIAPVRMALFAQMIKDKPWTTTTLKEMGGLEGIGATFLEESLAGPAANPEHRLHLSAARLVLHALLPEGGADIKGHMRSHEELLETSGYARRPRDFETLLSILGGELRLITPTDPRGRETGHDEDSSHPAGQYYHLTHDYLVPSLRVWLTRKDRETIGGRAAIRLAERTAEWTSNRSRRYLPSWWEWILILLFTRPSRRTPAERRLIGAANRHYGTRAAVLAAVVALFSVVAGELYGTARARAVVGELKIAEARNLPSVLLGLTPYRRWADTLLRQMIDDRGTEPRQKVRARLALLPVDASQAGALLGPLLDDDPEDFLLILSEIRNHGDRSALYERCREPLRNEGETPGRRLRAGMAIAGMLGERMASEDVALQGVAGFLADHLVDDLLNHPDRYHDWVAAMHPMRTLLIPPLEAVFRGAGRSDSARLLSATILTNFARDDPDRLTELLLDADVRQFPVILRALSGFQFQVVPNLELLIESGSAANRRDEPFQLPRRQANAAIGLFHWGNQDALWPLLRHSPDPIRRTYLIDRLARLTPEPSILVNRLINESDVSARRALILVLGGIPADQQSLSWTGPTADRLLALYEQDSDAGVHSAAEWTLRKWKLGNRLQEADARIIAAGKRKRRSWEITKSGHTMVTIPGPIDFRMGAGDHDEVSDHDEKPVIRKIPRTFSIASKETTARQYLEFRRLAFPNERVAFPNEVGHEMNCPISAVTWLDAVRYCRWLSEQEQIPEDQMCYPPISEIKDGMKPYENYLSRTGYRLTTEAEFEYACRAGAVTSRFFGDDPGMLTRYGWFTPHSSGQTNLVGLLMPNDFGLFDVLGNVKEWCQDSYAEELVAGADHGDLAAVDRHVDRVIRGGAYNDRADILRAANRYHTTPDLPFFSIGFRIARTTPAPP